MFRLEGVKYKNILDIDKLYIPKNKITCILGKSGSGKTTLLKLLNKLISCTQGEIYYNDRLLKKMDSIELRRNVVMLPQVPAIFPGTVKDNLLIGLKFSEKQLVSDKKIFEILNMVHLNKDLTESAENLSGGEKQRLALARVILMEPEVFLLDEPSSALDEDTEQIIIEKLVRYTKKMNQTLIMVTHSKKIAKTFADNIFEIRKGKVINQ
ncbi:MAG: UDP-glucose/iron transport system ATP-binding protein [Clostridia bacterium]|nr:UDP-glucose/iron transport system ATP-binding protein [Clostridia bacterium]